MKGIFMFDSINDLIFLRADRHLRLHINSLAAKEGLIEVESTQEVLHLEKDVVIQLFAPLLASFKVMQNELGNVYRSMKTKNEVLIAFQEHQNHVIIGIGNAQESDALQREVNLFSIYVTMLYGPSLYLMKEPLATQSGLSRLQMLSQLLDKWHQLRAELQMFLVEAVERLVVSPDVTAACVRFLQDTLHKIRASHKEGIFSHSFLLVNCKLLALYSSRNANDLPKVQLLLLIILAHVLKNKPSSRCVDEHGNPSTSTATNEEDEQTREDEAINSLLVFLKTSRGDVMPHIVYVINVTHQITLVILCEMTGMVTLSNHLMSLSEKLHNLLLHPSCRSTPCSYQSLDSTVKNLYETAKKAKLSEEFFKNVISKWELTKQCGLEEYLSCGSEYLELRLESAISSLCETSKTTFGEVIIRPELNWEQMCLTGTYREVFLTILKMSHKQLNDCFGYLESEVSENILLSSCMEDFPGLINFIYVDRSSDYIIAQSPIAPVRPNESISFKEKVWEMVHFGWQHVDGVDSFFCLWHKEQLRYFYSIWFEDSNGRRISPSETPSKKDLPLKGILCGNFYKTLLERCFPNASYDHIYCYELFCTHVETTSAADVIEQARHLSVRLWKYSGACKTPLDLL